MAFFKRKHEDGAPGTQTGLRDRLAKTRRALATGFGGLFGAHPTIDDALFDDLEDLLITCDVGVEASRLIVERTRDTAKRHRIATPAGILETVRAEMADILNTAAPLPARGDAKPYVLLVVGVNGVGKTTTIAKLAKRCVDQGESVVLAAGDTFRAAAVEQLQRWGERIGVPVVAQQTGADAAAVVHDALVSAQSKPTDVLIVDTAGRQHTHDDLMEQLKKVKRVLGKLDPQAPHEVMQVLDAGTGQNAASQLKHFRDAVGVNSVTVTKLDGTAKGGVLVALVEKYRVPVRYIGVGEGFEDLRPFDPHEFVAALVPNLPGE